MSINMKELDQENKMKLKNIVTMDDELTFTDIEVLNIKNEKQLDKAIAKNKVLEIREKRNNLQIKLVIYYFLSAINTKVERR